MHYYLSPDGDVLNEPAGCNSCWPTLQHVVAALRAIRQRRHGIFLTSYVCILPSFSKHGQGACMNAAAKEPDGRDTWPDDGRRIFSLRTYTHLAASSPLRPSRDRRPCFPACVLQGDGQPSCLRRRLRSPPPSPHRGEPPGGGLRRHTHEGLCGDMCKKFENLVFAYLFTSSTARASPHVDTRTSIHLRQTKAINRLRNRRLTWPLALFLSLGCGVGVTLLLAQALASGGLSFLLRLESLGPGLLLRLLLVLVL